MPGRVGLEYNVGVGDGDDYNPVIQPVDTQHPLPVVLGATGGGWAITSAPAVSTQATATKAAGAAGVRHVLTSIQASLNAVVAQAQVGIVVRDGASGVGAILWQDRVTAPAGVDVRISLSGLSIEGTAGNAMTVEFTAAPTATNFETVSATGYDTQ